MFQKIIIFCTLAAICKLAIGQSHNPPCLSGITRVSLTRKQGGIRLSFSPNPVIDARQGNFRVIVQNHTQISSRSSSGASNRQKRSGRGAPHAQSLFDRSLAPLQDLGRRLVTPFREVQIGQQHQLQINDVDNPVRNVVRRRIGTRPGRGREPLPVFRTEFLIAEIRRRHTTGGRTTFTGDYHRTYLNGTREDQRGHILASQFGGRATGERDFYYNLTPQHETLNQDQPFRRGTHLLLSWVEMETQLANHLAGNEGNWAEYLVVLLYPNGQSGRPREFQFTMALRGGRNELVGEIVGTLQNRRVGCLFAPRRVRPTQRRRRPQD